MQFLRKIILNSKRDNLTSQGNKSLYLALLFIVCVLFVSIIFKLIVSSSYLIRNNDYPLNLINKQVEINNIDNVKNRIHSLNSMLNDFVHSKQEYQDRSIILNSYSNLIYQNRDLKMFDV